MDEYCLCRLLHPICLLFLGSLVYDFMYGASICGGWLGLVSVYVVCGCLVVCLVLVYKCFAVSFFILYFDKF